MKTIRNISLALCGSLMVFGIYFLWDYHRVLFWIGFAFSVVITALIVLIATHPPKWHSLGNDAEGDGFYTCKNECFGNIDYDTRS